MPWVEPEEDDEEFIEFIKSYDSQSKPKVMELLDKYSYKDIHIFKSRNEAEIFLHEIDVREDNLKCGILSIKVKFQVI